MPHLLLPTIVLQGRPPAPFTPQQLFLGIISLGDGEAFASWGPLAVGGSGWLGAALWRWKVRPILCSRTLFFHCYFFGGGKH